MLEASLPVLANRGAGPGEALGIASSASMEMSRASAYDEALAARSVSRLARPSRHYVKLRAHRAGRGLLRRRRVDELKLRLALIGRGIVDLLLHGDRELSVHGRWICAGNRVHCSVASERLAAPKLEKKATSGTGVARGRGA